MRRGILMIRKQKSPISNLVVLLFSMLFAATSFSLAAAKKSIILGVGGGYSFFLDTNLSSYEVYYPKLIYFSEQLAFKYDLNLSLQYFPWRGFGFQLEFDQQKGSYSSDLKWYGYLTDDPINPIVEINHIEDPYRENWSISSVVLSLVYVLNFESQAKVHPYISAGVGFHFLNGDQERFKDRTRLGPEKSGHLVKLGLGFKYRITPRIGMNFRGVGVTAWRKEYGFSNILDFGPKQFYPEAYVFEGQIIRQEAYLVNSFTYLGIVVSLEYTF
jgi:hypothetical protein